LLPYPLRLPPAGPPWRRRPGSRPLVLGHRGSRTRAPENTLAAFEWSLREGADGVELDVRLDGSGEIVVLHDRHLGRTTGALAGRDVEMVPSSELRRLDLGRGERVPILAEVLGWASSCGCLLNIELKPDVGDRRRLVSRVAALVRNLPDAESLVLLSSFHAGMALEVGRRLERVPVAWLVHRAPWLQRSAAFCRSLGMAAIHPARDLVDPARVASWRTQGLLVNVWTVNDQDEAIGLDRSGVDGLITDDPALIVRCLAPGHEQSA
jgi:glycerophosphoryl diester phosphodiesterase